MKIRNSTQFLKVWLWLLWKKFCYDSQWLNCDQVVIGILAKLNFFLSRILKFYRRPVLYFSSFSSLLLISCTLCVLSSQIIIIFYIFIIVSELSDFYILQIVFIIIRKYIFWNVLFYLFSHRPIGLSSLMNNFSVYSKNWLKIIIFTA